MSKRPHMRVCIVGGIFGHRGADPDKLKITPETTLAGGLRELGHTVETIGHYHDIPAGFDIVHVHHLSYGALRAACSESAARFIFTSHDGPSLCGYEKSRLRRLASEFVMARADGVVALSSNEASFQRSAYTLHEAKHRVIPNGIPRTYRFDSTVVRGSGSPWRLLYVGQLSRLKRVDVLLRALAEVPEPAQLSLAFHNDTELTALRQLTLQLGIENRVSFVGACGPDQLRRLYSESDMLVLPSEAEALPSVVSEAMMCGLPVVASEVGGIPDQVGSFGRLVPPGDFRALAAAVSSVCREYRSLTHRAQTVAEAAATRFSVRHMIDAHIALYSDVMSAGSRARRHRVTFSPGNLLCGAALRLRSASL